MLLFPPTSIVADNAPPPPVPEEIEPTEIINMLLDKPDLLLHIFNMLGFRDRVRLSGMNRMLSGLEAEASPLPMEGRMPFHTLEYWAENRRSAYYHKHLMEEHARPVEVLNATSWGLYKLDAFPKDWHTVGVPSMLVRMLKCCYFKEEVYITLVHCADHLNAVANSIRFLKAKRCRLSVTRLSSGKPVAPGDVSTFVGALLQMTRENELLERMTVYTPEVSLSSADILRLVQGLPREFPVEIKPVSLTTAQLIGQKLMGLDPTILATPPDNVASIRTSLQNVEVYALLEGAKLTVLVKEGSGVGASRVAIAREYGSFTLTIKEWWRIEFRGAIRVPYQKEL